MHRLLKRQLAKCFGQDSVKDEALQKFVSFVNESYIHFDDSQELLQHTMRVSNEELFETNKRLVEESRIHSIILNSLKESVLEISPEHERLDNDLLKIADILKAEILKRKSIEKELVKAREIAESSLKTRETFFANMSHEIRTPMNGVIGMARLLAETELTAEQSKFQKVIQSSAEDLVIIINDILDITKMSTGNLVIESVDFNMCDLLKDVSKLMCYKAEEKGIYLRLNYDNGESGAYKTDPIRLKQIMINLLGNAIKFTERGGVELKVRILNSYPDKDTIRFSISDTGIGIAENKIDTIFNSFVQEDESTHRRFGGTGLGLSISKQLVEALGGELVVESTRDIGTSFQFTIDVAHGTLTTEAEEKIEEDKNLNNIRILLVEDNEINTLLATTVLEKWKCRVDAVENGKLAIDKSDLEEYDVILMDMQMPVMDGLEATEYIRKTLKLSIPIIGFTANALIGEKENCLNVGMDDYITKPFMPDDLYNKIASLVRVY
ncbi:MAG: ATP-binding protein [Flavobacteriales bacterium]